MNKKKLKTFILFFSMLIISFALIIYLIQKKRTTMPSQLGLNQNSQPKNIAQIEKEKTDQNSQPKNIAQIEKETTDQNSQPKNIAQIEKETTEQEILEKYGKYAFETLQRFPEIVNQIKEIDKNFTPSQMETSFPSRIYQTDDGRDYLLMGGCTPHDCLGTEIIVAYDITNKKVLIGKETSVEDQYLLFLGSPSEQEKKIINNFYLQR